jgi:hypothetical protein
MKFAPILAGATLGAVLLAFATAQPVVPPERVDPLDVSGIVTLRVRADEHVQILVDDAKKPTIAYPDSTKSTLRLRREGNTLVVDYGHESNDGVLRLTVPPSVHRFDITEGSVTARVPMAEAELLSPDQMSWDGDVRRLVLRDTARVSKRLPAPGKEECDGCTAGLASVDGHIGVLRVYSPRAQLSLDHPDNIGIVYAWLGSEGSVSMNNARRFDHIHVMNEDEGESAPTQPPALAPSAGAMAAR